MVNSIKHPISFLGLVFFFHPFHRKVHISFITTESFPSVTIYILRIHLQVGGSEKGNICFLNFIYVYQGRSCLKMPETVLTLYMDDYFLFVIFYQKYGNKDKVRMGRVSGMEISTK